MTYAKYEDGQIITTISGTKRLKTFCIACNEPVHFVKDHTRKHPSKDEKIGVRAHFRHTNNIQVSEAFLRQHRSESIAHQVAKQALVTRNFHFSIRCGCGKILPIKLGGERREEVPYDKYRLDVAYMNGDAVVGGVEVLHSSRVSDEKFRFLEKNLPWCEVKAENVLKSTGHIFAERSHNQVCESCKRIQACRIAGRAKRAEEAHQARRRKKMRRESWDDRRRRLKLEYELFQKRMQEEELEYKRRQKEREQEEKKREEEEQKERDERRKREARGKIERAWSLHLKDMELYNKLLN